MRYSQPEKMGVIKVVEQSALSVKRTLKELSINRSTFDQWYRRYADNGYDGLADRKPTPRKFSISQRWLIQQQPIESKF